MTGTISFSMEIELGWGTVLGPSGIGLEKFSDRNRSRETKRLRELLTVCDTNQIPIGFDIVGHLFLEQCDGHDSPHKRGWFDIDPKSGVESDPLFYAPDLIDMILESEANHEIGTHTFSHVDCGKVSAEVLDWEFEMVREIHEKHDVSPPHFLVPPRHTLPPLDVVENNGIEIVRYPIDEGRGPDSPLKKFLWHFLREPLDRAPESWEGVTKIPCESGASLTAFYLPKGELQPHPAFRTIPQSVRKRTHRRYLQRALETARSGGDVHLWAHLYDIANDAQWPVVREFMNSVGEAARSDEISVYSPSKLVAKQSAER